MNVAAAAERQRPAAAHLRFVESPDVLWAIAALFLAPVFAYTRADPDLWGHVRFGIDVIRGRGLPSIDPYSFTQDVPWVNHEWLSETAMGAAWMVGGSPGLAVLKGTLVAAFFAVVFSAYRQSPPAVLSALLVVVAAGTGRVTATLRPQLWSLLGVAILCRLLQGTPRRWWAIAVPTLFLLWVNLHGGWIVGAAILAVWTAGQMWRPAASRALAALVASGSAAATLANPYGWRMWGFLAETVRLSRPVAEWQPLWTTPPLAWLSWMAVVAAVAALVRSRHRPPADAMAIVALLAGTSLRVERLEPLFVAASVLLLSPALLRRWPASPRTLDPLPAGAARGLTIAIVVLAVVSAGATARAASCVPVSGFWAPDAAAGEALTAAHASGRMVTSFNWGEYAIWQWGSDLKVSIDGRRETVYSNRVLDAHDAIDNGTPGGLAYLARLAPDYIWLPASNAIVRGWAAGHGYRIDVSTPESFVAVRADRPVVPAAASGSGRTSCFPAP